MASKGISGSRKAISATVWKKLFAESGNVCAFPACPATLFRLDGVCDVQIAHINGIGVNSARHEPNLSDRHLDASENLLLMCRAHHDHIDTLPVSKYSEDVVRKMKVDHAARVDKAMEPLRARIVDVTKSNISKPSKQYTVWKAIFGRGDDEFDDEDRAPLDECLRLLSKVTRASRELLLIVLDRGTLTRNEFRSIRLERLELITETSQGTLRIHLDHMAEEGLMQWDIEYDDYAEEVDVVTATGPENGRLEYLSEFAKLAGTRLDKLIVELDWSAMDAI